MNAMNRSLVLWIIALVVTLASARWQRMTGPTHELPGTASLGGTAFHYTLQRTHKGPGDQRVEIEKTPAGATGAVEWKPYQSKEPWTVVGMRREGDRLVAPLPHQPPGGKLWYRVRLGLAAESVLLPPERPAAIRFTGAVPWWILIPHILFMLLAMLLATRAGLEALMPRARLAGFTFATLATLFIGGMVLGPFVTHYAFGPWWGGFPVGMDLTDNKTLIVLIGWIAATIAVSRARLARAWVVLAAVLMLGVFAIPHSWTAAEPTHVQLDTGAPAAPAR